MSVTMQGWLDKKSGGKEGSSKSSWLEKWDKRYFVLVGTQLSYYKHEEDHRKAKEPAGSIECAGAELFLKEVKGQAFRFTIQAKDRELKLRAPNASAYHAWSDALTPLVASTGRDSSVSVDERGALERTTSVAVPSRETDAPPSCSGWLEKKSGGKEGHAKSRLLEKWDRRYFVLLGSEMRYFKGEDDHNKGKAALGSIECAGAKLFLKEVKGTAFRFTVQNQTRELKLRAENASEYQKWTVALGPLVNPHTEELLLTPSERSAEGGGGDSPSAGRSRTNTLDTMANSFLDEMENERQSTSLDLGGAPLDERDEDALDASDDSIDPDSNTPAGVASLDESVGAPFKIIIVGDSGVGKTCLLLRFTEGRYDAYQRATVAVDISNAQLDLGSSTVGLALWDTAGQERFASLSAPYFRQADGVVVVFDVGKRSTFERVQSYWMDELFFKADPEVSVLLVGMKADIPEPEREVSDEEAINFAEQSGWLYFSASAKSGLHVRDAFYLLACTVMNRLNESDPKNVLNDSGDAGVDLAKGGGAKKGGCC